MNRKSLHMAWVLLLLAGAIVWYLLNQPGPQPQPPGGLPPAAYPHLRWGNPSGAKADVSDRNNYLMEKPYFALSYNDANGTPNWVSWRVVKEDLGAAPRFPFTPDEGLPAGFKKVTTQDYERSGFDRGHMCNHADRQSSEEASKATFVMSNIVPQSSANNEKGWEQFESYCRTLVKDHGKELYIVAGPQGRGGESRGHPLQIIQSKDGDITVPAKTWKVVMVIDAGGAPGRDTRLIAIVMPNDETVGDDWSRYRTTVRDVEKLTGYTFFDRADPAIVGPLKDRIDEGR